MEGVDLPRPGGLETQGPMREWYDRARTAVMKALKEWGEQYEQGQKQHAEQVTSLSTQVEALARHLETFAAQYEREQQEHAKRVEALTEQVEDLASNYKDLARLLQGL